MTAKKLEKQVLDLARETRAHPTPIEFCPPVKLYGLCGNDGALYNHALREAGYIVRADTEQPEDPCTTCGWSPTAEDG